jgi:formyl-CoA transferase
MSDSPSEVTRSPLLGEHTEEILKHVLGFDEKQIGEIRGAGALDPAPRIAAE